MEFINIYTLCVQCFH